MNEQRFTELVQQHGNRVYGHALYCLRDAEDAEDVAQETFLKLWHRYGEIDPDRVGAWLNRVVHNLCIDLSRRRGAIHSNFGYPDPDAVDRLTSDDAGAARPDDALQLDQEQQLLLDAMGTLPADTRSVMVMHYFQEMKLKEIAEITGKTLSALKVQIHRARKALRLVLDPPAGGTAAAQQETG